MALVLGVHVGHNASCAVMKDGVVLCAVQQERISRAKHDGEEALTDRLPIQECLAGAQTSLSNLDFIVSSFQSVGIASFGLHKPLIEEGFSAFDPFDPRHFVISHHLAHAWHAFGASGLDTCAVLILDRAGSSTEDGQDYALPFSAWYRLITSSPNPVKLRTECHSIYDADGDGLRIVFREYTIPHIQPLTFVWSAASLYDNVSRRTFGRDHAHGQLMALATSGHAMNSEAQLQSLLLADHDNDLPAFRNDWQHSLPGRLSEGDRAALASACQKTFEKALLQHVEFAMRKTGKRRLAAAGGVFLNILGNSACAGTLPDGLLHVPSAPNDAGISVGCAQFGSRVLAGHATRRQLSDRLGPLWSDTDTEVAYYDPLIERVRYQRERVVEALLAGSVVARCCGRSEFGPRALGGRSLLADPRLPSVKDRLNGIKGRQSWRPVAPVVAEEWAGQYFTGPLPSPHMLFAHGIRDEFRTQLGALAHGDRSTRVQTLSADEDPELYQILLDFGKRTGLRLLANTSLNGPNQPIVERIGDGIKFLLGAPGVDSLITDNFQIWPKPLRTIIAENAVSLRMSTAALVTLLPADKGRRLLVTTPSRSLTVGSDSIQTLLSLGGWRKVADVSEELAGTGEDPQVLIDMIACGAVEFKASD